ncbi:DNA binding domain-containing protein, excisionase family [Micrococcales bacterium KH10]|nr:DNA binding domain-containing protein, excisionase family [Micrococcales bacterium KH10]
MTEPLLMDAETAAAILDPTMSAKTLLRMAREGTIGCHKRGRLVRFTRRDLEDYVESTARWAAAEYRSVPARPNARKYPR